jgi:hypothetical protein
LERRFTDRAWIGGGAFQGGEIRECRGLFRILDGDFEGGDLIIERNKADSCGANGAAREDNGEKGDAEQGGDGV